MAKQVLIENERVALYYHTEHKIVHHEIRKFVGGEPFRRVLADGAKLLKEHGATKWLSDDRGYCGQLQEDIEWAIEFWEPEAIRNGWKYWAVVTPTKALGRMNLNDFIARYKSHGIVAEIFEDIDEAFDWLVAQ
jgi:hypothetical protein